MKNTLLIRRYAKAFLEFAINNNMAEEGLADLELISKTLKQNRVLRSILSQPFVTKEKKESIIKRVFGGNTSEKTLEFIMLILEKNRQEIIGLVWETYRNLYYEYKGIALVTITTAVQIDEPTQQRILSIIKDKAKGEIKVVNMIDKDIIGGFIIDYLDYQYDESVRTKLKDLETMFAENLYIRGY